MSNVVYFVSEEKIKAFTAIHENVDIKDILPYVVQAQDIFLQIILGSQFYSVLQAGVIATSLSAVNIALIEEYIAPYLLNAALYQMVPFNYVKLRNKGMLKGQSEEATTADLKDVQFYRDAIRTTTEFYAERLRRELLLNADIYPDWAQIAAKQNLIPNRRESFGSSMAIPNRSSNTSNQSYGKGMADSNNNGNTYSDGFQYGDGPDQGWFLPGP